MPTIKRQRVITSSLPAHVDIWVLIEGIRAVDPFERCHRRDEYITIII